MADEKKTVVSYGFDAEDDTLTLDLSSNESIEIDEAAMFVEDFMATYDAIKVAGESVTCGGMEVVYDETTDTLTVGDVSGIDAKEFFGYIDNIYDTEDI